MRSPCEHCECPVESGEDCPQCGAVFETLHKESFVPCPKGKYRSKATGYLVYVDETGWAKVAEEGEGCWREKGPVVELFPNWEEDLEEMS